VSKGTVSPQEIDALLSELRHRLLYATSVQWGEVSMIGDSSATFTIRINGGAPEPRVIDEPRPIRPDWGRRCRCQLPSPVGSMR
jgi:hypothetical protein